MKECTKCKYIKDLSKFYRRSDTKNSTQSTCKTCNNKKSKKYYRTKEGFVTKIFSSQKSSSAKRKMPKVEYTKQELKTWLFNNPNFDKLYNNWIKSRYKKNLTPSIDRLNDYEGYKLNNIQLITWEENKIKFNEDRKNGKNNKQSLTIIQLSLKGVFIKEYCSLNNASRETGINLSSITLCCQKHKHHSRAGNYKWEYKIINEIKKQKNER